MRRLGAQELPVETTALARALIGTVLVRESAAGRCAGRIVETEAYLARDPASHSFSGKTARNASMFLEPFHAYIYMIYGTAFCLNVSSAVASVGEAVLIRALEPLEGMPLMEQRRGTSIVRDLCRGPGRLCQAFEITRELDGEPLLQSAALWLGAVAAAAPRVGTSARIGITKAAKRRLRFYLRGSGFLSGPRALSP